MAWIIIAACVVVLAIFFVLADGDVLEAFGTLLAVALYLVPLGFAVWGFIMLYQIHDAVVR
jgi:hypothetical protein